MRLRTFHPFYWVYQIRVFEVDLREQDWTAPLKTEGPAKFRVKLETCPSCAETISQAIADEVKGIKARMVEKQTEAA